MSTSDVFSNFGIIIQFSESSLRVTKGVPDTGPICGWTKVSCEGGLGNSQFSLLLFHGEMSDRP